MDDHADFVVVGAGAAGCVLAERLSEDPRLKIAVLEAGLGTLKRLHSFPLLTGHYYRKAQDNWNLYTVPQAGLNGRSIFWPRGKRIGGSTIFNGMVYARGNVADYADWGRYGVRGWSYDDVLPYFRRNERYEDGADEVHGGSGMLSVTHSRANHELFAAFLAAGRQAGFGVVRDFNGRDPLGVGFYDFHLENGRRSNSARVLIASAKKRSNLRIIDSATVLRVVFDGKRAVGVEYRRGGKLSRLKAVREVVLCGGAIGSPHVLMLSGVGNGADIADHGIETIQHLPGVGRNLIDHLDVFLRHGASKPVSLLREMRFDRLAVNLARALLLGTGPVTESPIAAGGYFESRPGLPYPDLQAFFLPIAHSEAAVWFPFTDRARRFAKAHGYALRIGQVRPLSRGVMKLASPDADTAPLIDPNYLDHPSDMAATIAGLKIGRTILGQSAFDRYRGDETAPGADVVSESDLAAYVKEQASTVFHPVGTARMGTDPLAVVDERLRIHGIEGLRVADASVMPTIPSGNTNAPTMMVAEKAADLIREDIRGLRQERALASF